MFGVEKRETIPCKTCEKPTPMLGTKLCDPCWEVETRLPGYLNNKNAIQFVQEALNEAIKGTPPDPQHGREPEPKPLAQYLGEYLLRFADMFIDFHGQSIDMHETCKTVEQALDAYESTEQVKIRIERV